MVMNSDTDKQSISFRILSQKNIQAMTVFLKKGGNREKFYSYSNPGADPLRIHRGRVEYVQERI